jgi:hypothetical protein
MNPQGRFQSVTWLPKPVNTQALTGFSNTHNNPSTQLSSTQPAPPKRMDLHPSLPCSPSGSPSPSRAPVQLVQNLHAGTLRTRNVIKVEHRPSISDMQASNHGLDYTNNLYSQQPWLFFNNSSSFPKPRHKNEER